MIVVVYHADLDGRCSGAIAYRELMREGKEIKLIETNYDMKVIDFPSDMEKIYILDFSFSDDVFAYLEEKIGRDNIIWIDHHISVIRKLGRWSDLGGIRDINFSGAMLTWLYFNGNENIPYVVRLVDDYDRWVLQYDLTLNFYEWSIGKGLVEIRDTIWDYLLGIEEVELFSIADDIGGDIRNRRYLELMEHIGDAGIIRDIVWDDSVYRCMCINSTYKNSTSQLGHIINTLGYDIAWIWHDRISCDRYVRIHQMRSLVVDVSKIAESRGGGGHKNASGWHEYIDPVIDFSFTS